MPELNMTAVNMIVGIGSTLVGGILVLQARRLATLPRQWQRIRERHPAIEEFTIRNHFLETDRAVRYMAMFWRIDGALGIVGGISLIVNPRIRLP